MKKAVIILFLTCFLLFVLFTRQPDFFDSEITWGKIEIENNLPYATFIEHSVKYKIKLETFSLKSFKENETVKIIYSVANPNEAAYYSLFYYWFLWKEILLSLFIFATLFFAAFSINKNPEKDSL